MKIRICLKARYRPGDEEAEDIDHAVAEREARKLLDAVDVKKLLEILGDEAGATITNIPELFSLEPGLFRALCEDAPKPIRLPSNYVANEWYNIPHAELVFVPAMYIHDNEFIRFDNNETLALSRDQFIKINVKHRAYFGNTKPWFQSTYVKQRTPDPLRLDRFQNIDALVPTTKPQDALVNAFEYASFSSEVDLLYMLRKVLLKQRVACLRIASAVIITMCNTDIHKEFVWPTEKDDVTVESQLYWTKPLTITTWFLQACDNIDAGNAQFLLSFNAVDLTIGISAVASMIDGLHDPKPLVQVVELHRDLSTQRRRSLLNITESIKRRRGSIRTSMFQKGAVRSSSKLSPLRVVSNENASESSYLDRLLAGLHILDSFVNCPLAGRNNYNCGFRGYQFRLDLHKSYVSSCFLHALIDTSCLFGRNKIAALKHAKAIRRSHYSAMLNSAEVGGDQLADSYDVGGLSANYDSRERLRLWPFHIFFQLLDAHDVVVRPAWSHRLRLGKYDPVAFEMFDNFNADLAQYRERTTASPNINSRVTNTTTAQEDTMEAPLNPSSQQHPEFPSETEAPNDASDQQADPFFQSLLIDHRANGIKTFSALKTIFGFSSTEYECTIALLCCAIHLRNLRFHVHNQTDTFCIWDAAEVEQASEHGGATQRGTLRQPSRFMPSSAELPSARCRRTSSFLMDTDEYKNLLSGYVLTTDANVESETCGLFTATVGDKPARLIQVHPCPLSPEALESTLVCCDLLKLPVVAFLALFSPRLAQELRIDSELDLQAMMFSPFNQGALHDDSPRLVYLTRNLDIEGVIDRLPTYLGVHEWLEYDACYVYRNLLVSELYYRLFKFVRRKINASLANSRSGPSSTVSDTVSWVSFQSNPAVEGHGVVDTFHNFILQLVDLRLHHVVEHLATYDSAKLLADLLLNPVSPYYIQRLMVDFANEMSMVSFGRFLLANLPSDAQSCISVNSRREHVLQLDTYWGVAYYDTSMWRYLFDPHLNSVLDIWHRYTQSAVMREVIEDTECLLVDVSSLITSILANKAVTLHIHHDESPSTNDYYSLNLMEMLVKYRLYDFYNDLKHVHAPWMTLRRFNRKYGILVPAAMTDGDGTDETMQRVSGIISGCSNSRAFDVIGSMIRIHPQLFNQLESQWMKKINKKVSMIQALWRGGVVRQRYHCMKRGRKSLRFIQQAFKKAIIQQWNYFSPTKVFPEANDGDQLYRVGLHAQVTKELSKLKEDAYLLSECENMLKRGETKINPMETLLTQIVYENLKSPSIDNLASRLTKLKRQEALRKRILKALKINDTVEVKRLFAMLSNEEEIILTSLHKLKHDYETHCHLFESRARNHAPLRSYV